MARNWLMITLVIFLCLWGYSQDLPKDLREELARTNPFIEVWEGRIPLRLKPNQSHPYTFEEAKHWLREAAHCSVLADILRAEMKKPREVWAPFYRRAIFLAKGVYEKFGEFLYGRISPDNSWGKYGDVVMPIDEYFREYMQWIADPERPALDPFEQLYHDFFTAALVASREERIRRQLPVPRLASTSPLQQLVWSFRCLGEWRQAMEMVEKMLASYPQVEELFDKWIEYATKVYQKGALPTKFLLVQNTKMPQYASGMPAPKRKETPLFLLFKKGHHYVSLWRIALSLGWDVKQQGAEIVLKTQDKEVRLKAGTKVAYVNGFKVLLPVAVCLHGEDILVPLQFVSLLARAKLKWEKGKGFIRMLLPE